MRQERANGDKAGSLAWATRSTRRLRLLKGGAGSSQERRRWFTAVPSVLPKIAEQLIKVRHECQDTSSGLGQRTVDLVLAHRLGRLDGSIRLRQPRLMLLAMLPLAKHQVRHRHADGQTVSIAPARQRLVSRTLGDAPLIGRPTSELLVEDDRRDKASTPLRSA